MARKTTTTKKMPKAGSKAPASAAPRSKASAPAEKRQKRPMEVSPRIGVISPEDFEQAARSALGGHGWQKSFRAGTGFAQSTLTRYLRGIYPIPQHVAIIVELLHTLRNHNIPAPDAFTLR